MPLALLLSPDDQAVSAITGVLEEMSVTCERPMDGPSAARKLSTQNFDLVLVDCENLPAAKLIFDVCRHPKSGTSPVPIAIVDGRAGLPTAFRLGAELILTKPVAKDQARTTIRTAVSRLKKEEPIRSAHPMEAPVPVEPVTEVRAQAAAATVSGRVTPAKVVEAPEPPALLASVAGMKPAIEAPPDTPTPAKPAAIPSRDLAPPQSFAPASKPARPEPAPVEVFEDPGTTADPVLTDIDADVPTPVFSSYQPQPRKGNGSLYFLLFLMLAGGGFYAAWVYQPGFREMVQPWLDRAIGSLKVPGQSASSTLPKQPAPAAAPVAQSQATNPAANATTQPSQAQEAAASGTGAPGDSSGAPAAPSGGTSGASKEAASLSNTESVALPTTESAKPASPANADAEKEQPSKKTIAAAPSDEELPGEKTAVILSSQGAEKRLLHRVQPAYPAVARRERLEGTVVLKAVVGETGKVDGVRLVEGNPTLATAAIATVKQWRYRPYVRNGKTLSFQTIVLVDFQRR